MSIIDKKKYQFDKAIEHLRAELNNIRTGRAHSSLVENLMIDYYGTKTPLQQLATITTPDPRSILIQPWDKNTTKEIEKAIQTADLGLNPINEGNILRVPIPPLTEERRNDLVKIVNQKIEETKISVRNIREEIWRNIKKQEKDKQISEDEMFMLQKELQKTVDQYNEEIKKEGEVKEKEITTL